MAHFTDLHMREYKELSGSVLATRNRYVHNWFSNFDPVGLPVKYRGHVTPLLELAFVAAKNPDARVPDPDDREGIMTIPFHDRVFGCSTPGQAKRMGSSRNRGGLVELRPDWDRVNVAAMDFFLRQRWQPGTRDAARLAELPKPIVEVNNWGDNRWGATTGDWKGRNALGLLLDVVAEEIKAGHVSPGADEDHWEARQVFLVAELNACVSGRVVASPSASRQIGMF